ncbi:MAG: tRNA (guanosine(46)-N7)-methyltransferase TrmB [Parasporobacterium sp.]|nr:tRNA (guanosine(46)-N7)-methyltransferase TrmB [Parasporobacterium sp.]
MRLRNIKGSREVIAACRYVIQEEGKEKASFASRSAWSVRGKWKEVFGNDHPLCVEIGMGKGAFLMELARRNPGINYVGIEKYSSVLLRAVQKQEKEELPNVRLIRMEAENLPDVFAPGEVDKIYLNFSDPWPKDAHAGRRLTSRAFLDRYQRILKEQGRIEFKTDNQELFDFSVEEVREAGWEICALTRDLHNDPELSRNNILTEYEERWSGEGKPICAMHFQKPANTQEEQGF